MTEPSNEELEWVVQKRAADRLADEVAVLVMRGDLDARSPAGDRLLDYRNPPRSARSDRLLELESQSEPMVHLLRRYANTEGRETTVLVHKATLATAADIIEKLRKGMP